MIRSTTALVLSLLISPVLSLDAQAQSAMITEQEAHAIGVNAYLYFYSLLSMDITRKQSTNIEPGKEFGKGPMNMFVNVPEYPPANFKGVVRSNFDTLYSIAWLDMTKEPVVISVPDTNGRYYLLPMLDMWTDVFASPGWRKIPRMPTGSGRTSWRGPTRKLLAAQITRQHQVGVELGVEPTTYTGQ